MEIQGTIVWYYGTLQTDEKRLLSLLLSCPQTFIALVLYSSYIYNSNAEITYIIVAHWYLLHIC